MFSWPCCYSKYEECLIHALRSLACAMNAQRRSNLLAEIEGTNFAVLQAQRPSYGKIEGFLQNASGQGIDMIASNGKGKFAIIEAKGGASQRSPGSLSRPRGVQQGTHLYNRRRLLSVASDRTNKNKRSRRKFWMHMKTIALQATLPSPVPVEPMSIQVA